MTKLWTTFALTLLVINGISGSYGGWMLMSQPDGSRLDLSLQLLQHSPFEDYMIPGVILFVGNGLLSFAITWLVILKINHFEKLIVLQGSVLTVWIISQIIFLQTINYLHIVYGGMGLLLIAMGLLIGKRNIVT